MSLKNFISFFSLKIWNEKMFISKETLNATKWVLKDPLSCTIPSHWPTSTYHPRSTKYVISKVLQSLDKSWFQQNVQRICMLNPFKSLIFCCSLFPLLVGDGLQVNLAKCRLWECSSQQLNSRWIKSSKWMGVDWGGGGRGWRGALT